MRQHRTPKPPQNAVSAMRIPVCTSFSKEFCHAERGAYSPRSRSTGAANASSTAPISDEYERSAWIEASELTIERADHQKHGANGMHIDERYCLVQWGGQLRRNPSQRRPRNPAWRDARGDGEDTAGYLSRCPSAPPRQHGLRPLAPAGHVRHRRAHPRRRFGNSCPPPDHAAGAVSSGLTLHNYPLDSRIRFAKKPK